MSDIRRLPDFSHHHWWKRGWSKPLLVRDEYDGRMQFWNEESHNWELCPPGEYLPCPAPDWPPEPPPRPPMVWASRQNEAPTWWVHWRTERGVGWLNSMGYGAQTRWLTPHDHPEQSAEESQRILDEVAHANKID